MTEYIKHLSDNPSVESLRKIRYEIAVIKLLITNVSCPGSTLHEAAENPDEKLNEYEALKELMCDCRKNIAKAIENEKLK